MPLRVGIVGLGHMGRLHLQKLLERGDVEVSALCDIKEELKGHFPSIPFFSEIDPLFDLCDGVVISTPASTHFEIAKSFILKNKHVFVEKPLTTKSAQAEELIELAKKKAIVLKVGHIERFNPVFRKALSLISKPILIEAIRESRFSKRAEDVSVVMDLMIHDLDLLLRLFGSEPKELRAFGFSFETERADFAEAFFSINGVTCHLKASRISFESRRSITIFQAKDSLFLDLLGFNLSVKKKGGEEFEIKIEREDLLKEEIEEFITAIREDKGQRVDESVLPSIRVAEKIEREIESIRR